MNTVAIYIYIYIGRTCKMCMCRRTCKMCMCYIHIGDIRNTFEDNHRLVEITFFLGFVLAIK